MTNLIYHCHKVNKDLIDIPPRWAVYLPDSPTSSVSASVPASIPTSVSALATATGSAHPQLQPNTQNDKLSDGAVAGIVVSGLFALAVFIGIALAWRRSKKKNRRLTSENAKLADAASKEGFTKRMYDIINGSKLTVATENASTLVNSSSSPASHQPMYEQGPYGESLHVQDAYRPDATRYGHEHDDEIRPATPIPDNPTWHRRSYD